MSVLFNIQIEKINLELDFNLNERESSDFSFKADLSVNDNFYYEIKNFEPTEFSQLNNRDSIYRDMTFREIEETFRELNVKNTTIEDLEKEATIIIQKNFENISKKFSFVKIIIEGDKEEISFDKNNWKVKRKIINLYTVPLSNEVFANNSEDADFLTIENENQKIFIADTVEQKTLLNDLVKKFEKQVEATKEACFELLNDSIKQESENLFNDLEKELKSFISLNDLEKSLSNGEE